MSEVFKIMAKIKFACLISQCAALKAWVLVLPSCSSCPRDATVTMQPCHSKLSTTYHSSVHSYKAQLHECFSLNLLTLWHLSPIFSKCFLKSKTPKQNYPFFVRWLGGETKIFITNGTWWESIHFGQNEKGKMR